MVRLNRESGIEFYVGTDVNGNKIPIPFENILVTGFPGSGKSMFVHNLLQDTLLRYPERRIQFRVWSRVPEYELWDTKKVTSGAREIPNIRIMNTGDVIVEDLSKSAEYFLKEAAEVCRVRYNHLTDCRIKNIWSYNRCDDDREPGMVPLVYVLDEPMDNFSTEAKMAFDYIMKFGRATGVIILWITCGACRVNLEGFTKNFQSKFVFKTDKDNSECVLGSSICSNDSNRGVGQGMCIYQRYNLPYVSLDIPKFSYSLGKKIARALSQEI